MKVHVSKTKQELGRQAAVDGAALIRRAIEENGRAHVIVATGASQFEMLEQLVQEKGIDWSRVTAFHLDEYVGMPVTHPASFRKYLKERFVERLPGRIGEFHYVNGEGDAAANAKALGEVIRKHPIDVAFVGIGENAHLAFNDPPADFDTEEPYLIVDLDEACRRQQMGEGWFKTLEDVPKKAISMGIRQIMKSKALIAAVPDQRKAQAVKSSVEGPITNTVPSSIMQKHPNATVYLDEASASLLSRK